VNVCMVRLFTPGWVVVDAVSQAWELLQCMVVQILLLDAWGQYWPPCCHPCPRGAFFPNKQQQQHKTLPNCRATNTTTTTTTNTRQLPPKLAHTKTTATTYSPTPKIPTNTHQKNNTSQATTGQARKTTYLGPPEKKTPALHSHSTQDSPPNLNTCSNSLLKQTNMDLLLPGLSSHEQQA
jgi:hypothetical protein